MIVLEGPDNSGKSTLAHRIASRTGHAIQGSEGPPKKGENINDRIRRYATMAGERPMLFDRHPVISQPIYSMLAGNPQQVEPELIEQFYRSSSTIIYCEPLDRGLEGHIEKPGHDTPDHLEQVNKRYYDLLQAYRDWAVRRANFIYRIGDGEAATENLIACVVAHQACVRG